MRRWLGLTVEQAEALPWWEYALYVEQLFEDRPWITYAVQVEMPPEDEPTGTVGIGGDLAALGFNVRQVS